MKSGFILIVASFLLFPSVRPQITGVLASSIDLRQFRERPTVTAFDQAVCFANASSIEQLPAVIRDLSAAFNEFPFFRELLNNKRVVINLHDATCRKFDISAAVQKEVGDSMYYVKLNLFNRQATDNALAATLIHETMHCVLMNIVNRARHHDSTAYNTILSFRLDKNESSEFFRNEFFIIINEKEGEHELMYRLFYDQMVFLLKRFSQIHDESSKFNADPSLMMWSGLQNTTAFQKLSKVEKRRITETILAAKRLDFEQDN